MDNANYYESIVANGANPISAANWMTGNILSTLNRNNITINEFNVSSENIAKLINLIESNEISSKQGKEVFEKLLEKDEDPSKIVKSLGMVQITDENILRPMIVEIIENNMETVEEYKKGRSVFNFFVGQVMKQTKGQANPAIVAKIFKEEVEKR